MKIGDRVFVKGIVDEIRNDVVIIKNDGGYFGTVPSEILDKYAEQEPTTRQSCENCKILELLVDFELETICEDDDKDFEYCENNCDFKAPTKECYLHWAEHKRKAVSK